MWVGPPPPAVVGAKAAYVFGVTTPSSVNDSMGDETARADDSWAAVSPACFGPLPGAFRVGGAVVGPKNGVSASPSMWSVPIRKRSFNVFTLACPSGCTQRTLESTNTVLGCSGAPGLLATVALSAAVLEPPLCRPSELPAPGCNAWPSSVCFFFRLRLSSSSVSQSTTVTFDIGTLCSLLRLDFSFVSADGLRFC